MLEEEKIIKLLCSYYANDKLYIPQRSPGDILPQELYQFYEDQFNEFRYSIAHLVLDSDDSDMISNRPASTKSKRKYRKASGLDKRSLSGQPYEVICLFSQSNANIHFTGLNYMIRSLTNRQMLFPRYLKVYCMNYFLILPYNTYSNLLYY